MTKEASWNVPPLEVFKTRLDENLGSPIYRLSTLPTAGELELNGL